MCQVCGLSFLVFFLIPADSLCRVINLSRSCQMLLPFGSSMLNKPIQLTAHCPNMQHSGGGKWQILFVRWNDYSETLNSDLVIDLHWVWDVLSVKCNCGQNNSFCTRNCSCRVILNMHQGHSCLESWLILQCSCCRLLHVVAITLCTAVLVYLKCGLTCSVWQLTVCHQNQTAVVICRKPELLASHCMLNVLYIGISSSKGSIFLLTTETV